MSSKKTPKKARPATRKNIANGKGYENNISGSSGLFSPRANQFALLSIAVDKHCLRIFNVSNSSLIAEHTIDIARAIHLCWLLISLAEEGTTLNSSTPARPKKRKKTASQSLGPESSQTQLVGLGLTNGSILLYSPDHAHVARVLSHPTSSSPILAIASGKEPTDLWCSTADGFLILWNAARNELLKTFKVDDTPYTFLASFPSDTEDEEVINLLAANQTIKILTLPISTIAPAESDKIEETVSLTGHVSTVRGLNQDGSRLVSYAEGDRVINIWSLEKGSQGSLLANVSLDAAARQTTTYFGKLLAVSASDKVSIFELPTATSSNSKILSITPSSTVSRDPKAKDADMTIIAAIFIPDGDSRVRIASLKSGARPVFEDVRYSDENGKYIPQVLLLRNVSALAGATESTSGTTRRRYTENSQVVANVGTELAEGEDDALTKNVDGELDIDLAELSLGQRLTTLTGVNLDERLSDSEGDKDDVNKRSRVSRSGKTTNGEERLSIPTQSLSRTLVQALHSNDTRLLELCLMHTNPSVVSNTVKRLPPQLAVPLLLACVERLGRGARAGTGKGGGAGASSQRGTGLIRWVRAVLVVHTAHLITMPDLVTRLGSLHSTITARLALRDPLLSLSGRVDLILSQMELRSSGAASIVKPEKRKDSRKGKEPYRYVEGESTSEAESDANSAELMDIEKGGDDEGSVEDVELGGGSDDLAESHEGSEEDDDEDEEDEDEDEDDGPRFKGFIDDEAAEVWSEDESSEEDMT